MNYSKRLIEIAKSIKKGSSLIDVGCDHGYIAKILLDENIVDKVIESDISVQSLDKAKLLLSAEKYEAKVKFIHTDGLNDIDTSSYDTLLIAGMGEDTIINILSKDIEKVKDFQNIVLQAMGEGSQLRKYFMENNFFIEKERLFIDKDKYYRLYEVKYQTTNIKNYQFPVNFYLEDIVDLKTYYNNEIINLKNILKNINKEKNLKKFYELKNDLNNILKYMEKINEKR